MTINKRILMNFIVPVIQHGRQGVCHLNLSGMVANHLYDHHFQKTDPSQFWGRAIFFEGGGEGSGLGNFLGSEIFSPP